MIKTAARPMIPLAMHLDHGKNIDTVRMCIAGGYTSVMFDGSALVFEKNIAMTKKVVSLAARKKVSVEAELGRILGKNITLGDNIYTDPKQAKIFVQKTRVDSLAVAIGTKHGFNKGRVRLRFDILEDIQKNVRVPLVLHGGSQLKKGEIKKCISLGITKINIDSDLREVFAKTLRHELKKNKNEKDPRSLLGPCRDAVKEVARKKIKLFGCGGKA
jgi:tagatose 1,6-diphosphate aldolase GatY/KbaY